MSPVERGIWLSSFTSALAGTAEIMNNSPGKDPEEIVERACRIASRAVLHPDVRALITQQEELLARSSHG